MKIIELKVADRLGDCYIRTKINPVINELYSFFYWRSGKGDCCSLEKLKVEQ